MIALPSALALTMGASMTVRPSLSSPGHVVAAERPTNPGAPEPDGWAPRVLRTTDGTVVVRGPARPTPELAVDPTPRLTEPEAIARVADAGWPGAPHATLVVTAQGGLAWRVDPPASALGPSNPVFLVDAHTGALRLRHDRATDAQLRSFATNPIDDPVAQQFEVLDLDPAATDLRGERIIVFNCVQPDEPSVCAYATIDPSDVEGNFLHPAPDITVPADNVQLEDAFAVQSVHHHAERYLGWLEGLGIPGLPCHEQGEPIVLVANYKAHLEAEPILIANAAYTGDCGLTATFGQGPQADWGYDGDVVYHELSHGVVELMMGEGRRLGFSRRRGDAVLRDAAAMNEGIADFMAAVLAGNPVHAEYTREVGTGTSRRLDNALRCPASVTGQVHADGEIFGGALWDAYQQLGDPLLPVLLDTVALMPEDATFEEASTALVAVALQALGEESAQAIEAAFSARGLLDCPRVVPWQERERPLWLRPRGQGGLYDPMQPPPAQLQVDLPPQAEGFWLRFAIEIQPTPGFEAFTELHAVVRLGAPIEFSYTVDERERITVDADVAAHLPLIDAEATADGVWVEAPGEAVAYVALFNQSPNVTLVSEIEVEPVVSPAAPDSTGPAPVDASTGTSSTSTSGGAVDQGLDDGCGCRHRAPTGPWWLFLVSALGRGRRRVPRQRR